MINLPYTSDGTEAVANDLPDGVHTVEVAELRMVTTKNGDEKLVVSYTSPNGNFDDWLGFKTPAQGKRTFAYIARLHEIAGVDIPKGGKFNEEALVGTPVRLEIGTNDRGYKTLLGFPEKATADNADIPF